MFEIEIKAYCDDHEETIKRILSLGGNFQSELYEKDIYFKHPARDFAKTDEAFRIRIENNRNLLTYKGPKIGDKTKTRLEYEVEFNDLKSMTEIIKNLGFETSEEIIKNRIVYLFNNIEICVDSVEGLGNFIELEKKGEDIDQAERQLFEIAGKLGLTRFERKSYLELKLENNTSGK